jgi:hypothetical protein
MEPEHRAALPQEEQRSRSRKQPSKRSAAVASLCLVQYTLKDSIDIAKLPLKVKGVG